MGKRILLYSAVLIGTYLGLSKATQGGQLLKAAGSTGTGLVKTFQGR